MGAGGARLAAIDDGRMGVVIEIDRGVGRLGIGDQFFQRAMRGIGKERIDAVRGNGALGADGQVDGRDIGRRHADRLGLDAAGQLRQQAFDAAGHPTPWATAAP